MAKKAYVGINGISKNVKNIYVGVNGVPKKVIKGYVGVNGVPKVFWDGNVPPSPVRTFKVQVSAVVTGSLSYGTLSQVSVHPLTENPMNNWGARGCGLLTRTIGQGYLRVFINDDKNREYGLSNSMTITYPADGKVLVRFVGNNDVGYVERLYIQYYHWIIEDIELYSGGTSFDFSIEMETVVVE